MPCNILFVEISDQATLVSINSPCELNVLDAKTVKGLSDKIPQLEDNLQAKTSVLSGSVVNRTC